ncbi:MAG: caspase family protein [Chitinophagaceae bacterium]|nr:caspase family protein [Chitinophagaceae bacterium]
MRLLLSIIFILISSSVYCQTIYEFQLKLVDNKEYDALLLLETTGKGIVRLKLKNDTTPIFEMELQEQQTQPLENEETPGQLIYEGSVMKNIRGTEPMPSSFNIIFGIKNNEAEPSSITNGEILKLTFITNDKLTRSLVQKYFTTGDAMYKNLFVKSTRGLTPGEKNTRIHLIIVANTNDPALSQACKIDMERVETTFLDITDVLGINPINIIKIEGNNYSRANVLKAINSIKAPFLKRGDIIVFYYTGHGFRTPDKKTIYPMMDLRSNYEQKFMEHYLSIDSVFNLIRAKGARMNLVMSDCCNWEPDMPLPFVAPDVRARSSEAEWDVDKLKALFLNPKKINILSAAADKNQLAMSNAVAGSFFFKYFNESLTAEIKKTNRNPTNLLSWNTILSTTQKLTYQKSRKTYCSKPYISQNLCNAKPIFLME